MVESLRRAVERLEPPICPGCNIEMKWYRSVKVAESAELIAHFFQCTNCNRLEEVKTRAGSEDGPPPPPKLSRPAAALVCEM